jgi:predicted MFS family arabinose efflux permease
MKNLLPPALLYFSNAILFISLFTRLPAIQASLGIDKAGLGLALLSAPVGTFLALPLAGRINDRFTPRLTALVTLPICAMLTPALTVFPVVGFVICFFLFGFFRTIFDVAANMISAGIEQRTGRKVLSRSHGFWSVGLLAGSLGSGFLAEKAVTPFVQQTMAAGFVVAACLLVFWITPKEASPQTRPDHKRGAYVLPDRMIVLICVMVFGLCIVEGAVYDWGIFFLREQLKADPAIAGVLYAAFTVGMGLTRLSGDMLRDSFGSIVLMRASAVSVALGIVLLVATPSLTLSGLALFLIGCGVALAYPPRGLDDDRAWQGSAVGKPRGTGPDADVVDDRRAAATRLHCRTCRSRRDLPGAAALRPGQLPDGARRRGPPPVMAAPAPLAAKLPCGKIRQG